MGHSLPGDNRIPQPWRQSGLQLRLNDIDVRSQRISHLSEFVRHLQFPGPALQPVEIVKNVGTTFRTVGIPCTLLERP